MFETIVRLTDEQEALLRRSPIEYLATDPELLVALNRSIFAQLRDALKLYDELVAEAKAKSDD